MFAVFTCCWCAPTALVFAEFDATGGASFVVEPWQLWQLMPPVWTAPSTCCVVAVAPVPVKMILPDASTVVLWQALQAAAVAGFGTDACTASVGGPLWQESHAATVVVFHCHVATVPFTAAGKFVPWQ